MQLRIVVSVAVVLIAVLAVVAWNRNATHEAAPPEAGSEAAIPPDGSTMPPDAGRAAPAQDPGVTWRKPSRWIEEPASGMRLATYQVPAPTSGGEAARCAVYYFGPGQGGGTEANIERWIGEFEHPGKPSRRSFAVRGVKVSQVEVTGTFMAHAGPSPDAAGASPGWTLHGAVVEGPNGDLFFKLTGPTASAGPAAREFAELLGSLEKK